MGPPDAEDAIRLRYLMTSLRRRLTPSNTEQTLQLDVAGSVFSVVLGPLPQLVQGSSPAQAALTSELAPFVGWLRSERSLEALLADPAVTLEGPSEVLEQFRSQLRAME